MNTARIRKIIYILLPMGIAFYLIYPLLAGDYIYPLSEHELYKSFMVNFIDALRKFELPIWNEYIGCGHPALCFGHYPLSLNTVIYIFFGFNDLTYYFTKFLGLVILFISFIYVCKYLRLSYLIALIGVLTYFSINFVIRVFVAETIGYLLFIYPVLMIFVMKIIDEKNKKDILIFSVFYIIWLSGGHIIYVYMHTIMLSFIYLITIFVFYRFTALKLANIKKFILLYFILFIIPFLTVLYQYYFIYDVISVSNRFKEGLMVSPFESTAWRQFIVSLQVSSYFWVGLFLILIYVCLKLISLKYSFIKTARIKITSKGLLLLLGILFYITATKTQFTSNANYIVDYVPILNSAVFRIALFLYITMCFVSNRKSIFSLFSFYDFTIFLIFLSLLSYYFYSPENIIGDVEGYDYALFKELGHPFRTIFILSVLFSIKDYKNNKIVKIVVLSSIALYFIRSHFTILLLRFTGIVWYAPRDGSIFSVFFAILSMYGLKNMLSMISYIFEGGKRAITKYIQYGLLLLVLGLLVQVSFNKLYKGASHRFIYPNQMGIAKSPMEKWVLEGREEVALLKNKLLILDKKTKHFYRIFTPENHYLFTAGNMQQYGIHEAFIYESSISRELQDLYDYTILGKVSSTDLKDVMPYFLFTKHVHAGLNLQYKEIRYSDFFMFLPTDNLQYLKNQNVEFLWDIMQVRYLIIGPQFSDILEGFNSREQYHLIAKYPKVNLNLYEIVKNKSYSKLAILPLNSKQGYDEIIAEINSRDINILKKLYSKLVFLDQDNSDFSLLKNHSYKNKRYYEIFSKQEAILINFESWNRNWSLKINNKKRNPQKVFQLFNGIKIDSGLNKIELVYHVKYFKELFLFSVFAILIYIVMLVKVLAVKQAQKTIIKG